MRNGCRESGGTDSASSSMWLAFLGFLLLLVGTGVAQDHDFPLKLTQYSHTAWRSQEDLFSGTPSAIAQTTDGYLWIGTNSGLIRFDGVRFVEWKNPKATSPQSFSVYSLLASKDGSLWIGTGKALARLRNNELSLIPRDKIGRVNAILEDRHGDIWLARTRFTGKEGPLCRVSGSEMRCFGEADGFHCPYGEAIAEDDSGSIWMGSYPGVCRWSPNSSETYLPEGTHQGETKVAVDALVVPTGLPLLVGFEESGRHLGLEQLINGQWQSFNVPGMIGSDLTVTSLLSDNQGGVWVGTDGHGLYHLYHGTADHFGSADGLSADTVASLYQDHEGSVWVITSGGIDRFYPLRVVPFSTREGLTSDSVQSVIQMPDDTMVFAAVGGLNFLKDGKLSMIDSRAGFPGRLATSLFLDDKGKLWVGIDDQLTVFANGKFRRVKTADGASPGQIIEIAEDAEHTIWALTSRKPHTLFRLQDGRLEAFSTPGFNPQSRLVADPVRGFWIQTSNGDIARYQGGGFQLIKNGGMDYGYDDFAVENDGTVWAWGAFGLLHWKNGNWSKLDSSNGLPCDGITNILRDGRGSWWVYLKCGLAVIRESELKQWANSPQSRVVPEHVFDAIDGAHAGLTSFTPGAALGKDGRLWFANGRNLQMIDVEHLTINSLPAPVHVEQLIADRRPYGADGMLHLPAVTREVRIDYTALSLAAPHKVRFRYKLSGVDNDWQDVGERRQAFYMNLKPGKYDFSVIACNNDGLWNMAGDRLSFIILPAFYQTTWFLCLVIGLSVATIWAIFRIRLQQATTALESRLGERLMERDRIARDLHDTLLQGFQALLLRLQTAMNTIPPDAPVHQVMENALDRADQVLLEGRNRVKDLRSHETGKGNLVEPLEQLIEELRELGGPSIRLTVVGEPRALQFFVADETYLIAREALGNAMRHSLGSEVLCELRYEESELLLISQDNGVGIGDKTLASGGKSGHWGLLGMRERARKIDATLTIDSRTSGTRIELQVPGRSAFAARDRGWLRKVLSRLILVRK
jgi:signal transduction histidine kinase/ligand-binding sensor domain-containing protein